MAESYNWSKQENLQKWKGIFAVSLRKVLAQVHPTLAAQDDALYYVEGLILSLLAMLTVRPSPCTVADVQSRVFRTFPKPIDEWAIKEAQLAVSKGRKKASLVLPVEKVHSLLSRDVLYNKVDEQVTLFIVAVLEYISADILKLAGNYVKHIRHVQITCQDIKISMCADKELMDMFYQEESTGVGGGGSFYELANESSLISSSPLASSSSLSLSWPDGSEGYRALIKDFILDEKLYLRDLHTIRKVFKTALVRLRVALPTEIDRIFSNILEISEFSVTLIGLIEDTLEMTEEDNEPAVGSCFEELAEAEEFNVYDKYSIDILDDSLSNGFDTLNAILLRSGITTKLMTYGNGFKEALKYYLPKLLLRPIYHCMHYFKYFELMIGTTESKEESDTLKQVAAMITPLHNRLQSRLQNSSLLKRKPCDIFYRLGLRRCNRIHSLRKLNHLQISIENWEGKDIAVNSSELVCEGKLKVVDGKRRLTNRYVFLCDGLLIVCKQISKRSSVNNSGISVNYLFKYRAKYPIRLLEIIDRDNDTSEYTHSFELVPRDQSRLILKAESAEEKHSWMGMLVMLNAKSMLDRRLDQYLSNDENKHPLKLPFPELYPFAETESSQNVVYEQKDSSQNGALLIKGATLIKLVERLTYHLFTDPMFMKTFLTTYRSFCSSADLLDLLIKRFNIPEPDFVCDFDSDSDDQIDDDEKSSSKMRIALDLKRFRTEYSQPVQFRVLNVLKHWVDQHFYDFDADSDLLHRLTSFLDSINSKAMKKWVDCISKVIMRRLSCEENGKNIVFNFDRFPPPIEEHIRLPQENWPHILTFHPIEIARQLTLLEYQYYRSVKPSELVDQAWTRKDKDKRSPNLLKMVRHTTNFSRYLQKLIVDTENMEERVAIVQRILEIMLVLQEYNNFNGVISITSTMNSSAIHRLVATKERIASSYLKSLEEASSYICDHFKLYWEKLRSINPPCVPFFGQYQTNILFLEEGNPDFLHNTNLINFAKRRKVAEIISEIQQYQNQPYCLSTFPLLQKILEELNPFPNFSEKEITDYLWQKSNQIEPKLTSSSSNDQPVSSTSSIPSVGLTSNKHVKRNIERKWPTLNLRSPGIKPKVTGTIIGGLKTIHPIPLPKILRQTSSDTAPSPEGTLVSPLNSPMFHLSPVLPTPKEEAVMVPIILPTTIVAPPLPPKAVTAVPPSLVDVPRPRENISGSNSPPPPIPPRKASTSANIHGLVVPPSTVIPPRKPSITLNSSKSLARCPAPPPLVIGTSTSEFTFPPSLSPLWCHHSRDPHSPCWSARQHQNTSASSSEGSSGIKTTSCDEMSHHFTFSQHILTNQPPSSKPFCPPPPSTSSLDPYSSS